MLTRKLEVTKPLMNGDDVKTVQSQLIKLGYDLGSHGADGVFGPATEKAVKEFQAKAGIKADGIVGPITEGKLNERSPVGGSGGGSFAGAAPANAPSGSKPPEKKPDGSKWAP
jgi:peptidoglycan hydrolase-like protein with peptidoglycan-binding domain